MIVVCDILATYARSTRNHPPGPETEESLRLHAPQLFVCRSAGPPLSLHLTLVDSGVGLFRGSSSDGSGICVSELMALPNPETCPDERERGKEGQRRGV
jgi:hypothetical protein